MFGQFFINILVKRIQNLKMYEWFMYILQYFCDLVFS